MRIVEVEDDYIQMLRNAFPSVMDEKRFHRTHKRKYIGVILTIGDFNYYAPFSSPKKKDYKPDGSIKKDSLFSLHMVKDGENGKKILLGTIKLINMIPIPLQFVIGYSIENETDVTYRDVIEDEFLWINKNQQKISKKARLLYNFKKHEASLKNVDNAKVYESILPFIEIESFLANNNLL